MSESIRNLFILIGVIMLGALGWYMYNQNRSLELQMQDSGLSLDIEIQEFIAQQRALQQLSFHSFLFDDPIFKNLNNITSPVPIYNTGRENPFLFSNTD